MNWFLGQKLTIFVKHYSGRAIRYAPGKRAEVFTLVLRNTAEEGWFNKSTGTNQYITIDESNLDEILKNNININTTKVNKFDFLL